MSTASHRWNNYHPPRMDDSDRNILAGLRHEPCEAHCSECGRCDWEPTGPNSIRHIPMTRIDDERSICPDCLPEPWRPEPQPTGYNPGPALTATHDDVTLTVQRTHLYPHTAVYYWQVLIEGRSIPMADGTYSADATAALPNAAAAIAWLLAATPTASMLAHPSYTLTWWNGALTEDATAAIHHLYLEALT